jgi:hypothetical protein
MTVSLVFLGVCSMFVFLWTGIQETLDDIPLQGLAFIPNETHQHIIPNFTDTPASLSFSILALRPAFPQEYANLHNPRTQRNLRCSHYTPLQENTEPQIGLAAPLHLLPISSPHSVSPNIPVH